MFNLVVPYFQTGDGTRSLSASTATRTINDTCKRAMHRLNPASDILPLSSFRANAASLIKRLGETRRPLVITQRGRGTAVVLDAEEYERLMEELELLRDVRKAEEQLDAGAGVGHEDAKASVLARLKG